MRPPNPKSTACPLRVNASDLAIAMVSARPMIDHRAFAVFRVDDAAHQDTCIDRAADDVERLAGLRQHGFFACEGRPSGSR